MDRIEVAWAAGLFDGEGWVGMARSGRAGYKYLRLAIGQAAPPDVLHRFKAAVGVGDVQGPYKSKPGCKLHYQYRVRGFEKVQAVVAMLWPFLSRPKKDQAKDALLAERNLRGQKAEKEWTA